jgi:flagellar protein FlgJ
MTTVAATSAATSSALALTPQAPAQSTQLKEAAKQFEAIFVRQMLAQAHAAKPAGEDSLFGGQAMDTFNSMQDERYAKIAADSGAFGLAKQIETQLAAQLHLASTPAKAK